MLAEQSNAGGWSSVGLSGAFFCCLAQRELGCAGAGARPARRTSKKKQYNQREKMEDKGVAAAASE
jgi:hypothetical protein